MSSRLFDHVSPLNKIYLTSKLLFIFVLFPCLFEEEKGTFLYTCLCQDPARFTRVYLGEVVLRGVFNSLGKRTSLNFEFPSPKAFWKCAGPRARRDISRDRTWPRTFPEGYGEERSNSCLTRCLPAPALSRPCLVPLHLATGIRGYRSYVLCLDLEGLVARKIVVFLLL